MKSPPRLQQHLQVQEHSREAVLLQKTCMQPLPGCPGPRVDLRQQDVWPLRLSPSIYKGIQFGRDTGPRDPPLPPSVSARGLATICGGDPILMAEANNLGKGCQGLFFSRGEMCEAEFGHNGSRDLAFTQFRLSREIYPQTEE